MANVIMLRWNRTNADMSSVVYDRSTHTSTGLKRYDVHSDVQKTRGQWTLTFIAHNSNDLLH